MVRSTRIKLKPRSPLEMKRRRQEIEGALTALNKEACRAFQFNLHFTEMCGGWINAIRNENSCTPNDYVLRGAAEVLGRHLRTLGGRAT
jgi:hypothetical protein